MPDIRPAMTSDIPACVRLRGLTRENAISEARLASVGITAASWAADLASGRLCGWVCSADDGLAGYCFGNTATGEVVVLALLPAFEGQGLGRALLARVVAHLGSLGHHRLFLGCSTDPQVRSHGFYRHLGWQSTGRTDDHGDELLALTLGPMAHTHASPIGVPHVSAPQSSALLIRDATPADAAALREIYAPHVRDSAVSFEAEVPSEQTLAERIAHYSAGWAWLVAELDGAIAGYAYGSPHRERAAYRWTVETSAYVAPGGQGRGVGRALYLALFDRLAARGFCNAMAILVLPNAASVRLHEAVGFSPVGTVRRAGWKRGAWHDVAWYQRPLREGPPPDADPP